MNREQYYPFGSAVRRIIELSKREWLSEKGDDVDVDKDNNGNILYIINDDKLKKDIYKRVYGFELGDIKSKNKFIFSEEDINKYLYLIYFR